MKVAALQMVSATTVQANLERAGLLLAQAAEAGAELAVLPEYFCLLGRRDTDKLAVQEAPGQGPIQDFLAAQARKLGLWIVGGTLPLSTDQPGRVRNSSLVWSPTGEPVARYDKIHLFCFDDGERRYDEAASLTPGRQPVSFEMQDKAGEHWHIGLSVCYDLRFPELFRSLGATKPLDLIVLPAAFTDTTGKAHWELLLRARAVENLCHVLAPAQGGLHENGRRTFGHSLVIEPWGEVLAVQAEGPGVVLADITHERQTTVRTQLPALTHRVLR